MHGFALAYLGLVLAGDPVGLPGDVYEIGSRRFHLPIHVRPDAQETIECIRLFVSVDQGKTWKRTADYRSTDDQATFLAPDEGLYWFAVQVVHKDGTNDPPDVNALTPAMKVFVNSTDQSKARKPVKELRREVKDLARKVRQLQKRIKHLESEQRRKGYGDELHPRAYPPPRRGEGEATQMRATTQPMLPALPVAAT